MDTMNSLHDLSWAGSPQRSTQGAQQAVMIELYYGGAISNNSTDSLISGVR